MLTKLEVRTPQGIMLPLPVPDASSGLRVQDIQGLGPVKATLVSSGYAGRDGKQYQAARREERNIVITVGLEPFYSGLPVRQLRQRLYDFFMPKSVVDMRYYMQDGLIVDIRGHVESCDPPMFTKEPEVQISVLCFDPDFVAPDYTMAYGSTAELDGDQIINYDGTVETGFVFRLHANRSLSGFTIFHTPPSEDMRQMEIDMPLVNGDVLEISTVPGSKYVRLTRSGVESPALYALAPYSAWLALERGENTFRVQADGAAISWDMMYYKRYGGL